MNEVVNATMLMNVLYQKDLKKNNKTTVAKSYNKQKD